MGLRQLLDVGNAGRERIVEKPHCADLQHVQDDLGVLRVVLVPAVVQGFARPGQARRRGKLQFEHGLVEMVRQRSMIVAGRLKADGLDTATKRQARSEAAIQ